MKERNVKNIVINYDNGESEVLDKGFAVNLESTDDSEKTEIQCRMCNMRGCDLELVVSSVLALADKLGMFSERGDEQ